MMFKGNQAYDLSFDRFADSYHLVRPGYPNALFEDVREQCRIDSNSRLLEIGAGSGIATVELARFGGKVTAIEPGTNLAEIVRQQTVEMKNVTVFKKTFESFQPEERFDAILAFTAFHWLKEEKRYQRTSEMLSRSGSLVLVWNSLCQSDSSVTAEVNGAYHEFLSDVYPGESSVADVNKEVVSRMNAREREIVQNSLFYTIFLKKYLTICSYDDQTYPKLLNTFPKIVGIEEERRRQFLEHISAIVKRHGKISVPVLATLIICKKKSSFLEALANPEEGL